MLIISFAVQTHCLIFLAPGKFEKSCPEINYFDLHYSYESHETAYNYIL